MKYKLVNGVSVNHFPVLDYGNCMTNQVNDLYSNTETFQSMIEDYIKNNLRVELTTDYSYSDSRQEIITTIYLGDDEVSKDSEYINID